jgi:hypothetical protein
MTVAEMAAPDFYLYEIAIALKEDILDEESLGTLKYGFLQLFIWKGRNKNGS